MVFTAFDKVVHTQYALYADYAELPVGAWFSSAACCCSVRVFPWLRS